MEKVAKITKLYGAEGQAVLTLFASFPEELSLSEPIFVRVDGLSVPLYFESFERRGRNGAVVQFADIDSERRIMEFVGSDLLLPEVEAEEIDDEFFMEDLVGFVVEIVGEEETIEGSLTGYIHSEVNPLFEVEIAERSVLIPAAEEFIHSIDFDGGVIRFVVPEGLLDL